METTGFKSIGKNAIETNPNELNEEIQGQSKPISTTSLPNIGKDIFKAGGTREILRYPRQSLEAYGYDYIEITAYDYVPSGLDVGKKLKQGFKGSNRRFTRRYETIQLPMQPQLSESTAVSWGGDSLNAVQAAGARTAQNAIEKFCR